MTWLSNRRILCQEEGHKGLSSLYLVIDGSLFNIVPMEDQEEVSSSL